MSRPSTASRTELGTGRPPPARGERCRLVERVGRELGEGTPCQALLSVRVGSGLVITPSPHPKTVSGCDSKPHTQPVLVFFRTRVAGGWA